MRGPRPDLLITLALLLFPATAHAGTVNLRWGDCWGDGGAQNASFACNTNAGSHALVGSFISSVTVPDAISAEIILDLAVADGTLPPWWHFKNAGSCRLTSLSASAALPLSAVQCVDWGGGQAVGFITDYLVGYSGPETARIRAAFGSQVPVELTAGTEYFLFQLILNHAKSTGTGACAGCDKAACLEYRDIQLTTQGGTILRLGPNFWPPGSSDHLATWQGGAGVVKPYGHSFICAYSHPTTTRTRTWGEVKALYR
jgi:hypothetical protein